MGERWRCDQGIQEGSKHKQHRRLPLYPEMEERLYHEYKDLRKKEIKVKGYWFRICTKHIMEETSPKNKLRVCQILGLKALNIDAESVLDELQTPVKGHLKRSKWQSKVHVFIEESKRSLSKKTENKLQFRLQHIANVDHWPDSSSILTEKHTQTQETRQYGWEEHHQG